MYRRHHRRMGVAFALVAVGIVAGPSDQARAQAPGTDSSTAVLPPDAPAYLGAAWRSALRAPRFAISGAPIGAVDGMPALATGASASSPETIYNQGGTPLFFNKQEVDADASGSSLTVLTGGAVVTGKNAFFQSLGTNGRSCITCHQPPSGMSVNLANINARYVATSGADPLFAPVDGATCPNKVSSVGKPASAFSLLLNRGLFRVFLPVPAAAEFAVTVLSDPYGCNTDPNFALITDPNTGTTTQIVSVYRRPLITANLAFVNAPIPSPPATLAAPPAIMWDERESSLSQQASDATMIHAQALAAPTADQVNQIVQFELGVFEAQRHDSVALSLIANGATGGPLALAATPVGVAVASTTITAYGSWANLAGAPAAAQRASIARGEAIFTGRSFVISNTAGLGTINGAKCSTCHRQGGAANDPFGQAFAFDDGIGGGTPQFGGPQPSSTLPIFQVTCRPGHTTKFNGSTVVTNDPGMAMISGKCTDIEKFKAPQLRSLANRAPYFSDGSAATLSAVVNFYNTRFSIGLSTQDQTDLANFLSVL